MNAADLMTPAVIAIRPEAPLSQAVRLMIDNRVSGLPVLDEAGQPVGMLTEGDLLRRAETGTEGKRPGWFGVLFTPGRLAGDYVLTHGRQVADVMTPDVISVEETTPIEDVVELMRRRRIKRVPVTRGGLVVGIVSRADILRALARRLDDAPPQEAGDTTIRETILAELAHQPWAPRRSVSIDVQDGVVQIDGVVFDVRERDAFRVAAENAPGVKRVENRLVCVEPNTGMVMAGPDDETPAQVPTGP